MANGIYRHLSEAEDAMWARVVSCVLCWWVIQAIISQSKEPSFEIVADVVRMLSAEVEYSQNNLDKLYAFAFNLIKL